MPVVEEGSKRLIRILRAYGPSLLLAILLALIMRSTIVSAYVIPSGSMLRTLEIGDRVLVNKLAYGLKVPFKDGHLLSWGRVERGEVVVFEPPFEAPEPYIKRVIGLSGDRILIRDKQVWINGSLLEEPYVRHQDRRTLPPALGPRDSVGPILVPEGKLFVMGDNRDYSHDSRFWGFVDQDLVLGQAAFILWSWDQETWRFRWSRIGRTFDKG